MNTALMFSTGQNATGTPVGYFAALSARVGGFGCDVAADQRLTLVPESWYGPDHADPARRDALVVDWPTDRPNWLNPPYSDPEARCARSTRTGEYRCKKKRCRKRGYHIDVRRPGCIDFIRHAAEQRRRGVTTWALVAARTDTAWFHRYVWDAETQRPRDGVAVEFLPGRLIFRRDGAPDPSPFPSMLVIFCGVALVSAKPSADR
jgi:hypothetical protein